MHPVREGGELRGGGSKQVVSVVFLLCHKIAVTLFVNKVMVQEKRRQVTCFLSKRERRL